MSFSQKQMQIIQTIEELLGTFIEEELNQLINKLPNMTLEQVFSGIINHPHFKRFHARMRVKFPDVEPRELEGLLKEYLDGQLSLIQSVSLERDVLTLSQHLHQHFDLEQSLHLLEKIHQKDFIPAFSTDQLPKNIQALIKRIQNYYIFADIKKSFFEEALLTEEPSYKKLLESLMWVNSQRQLCIVGQKNISEKKLPKIILDARVEPHKANDLYGPRSHLQTSIGTIVDEELKKLSKQLATTPVAEIVKIIESNPLYQSFFSALGSSTRAGFNTYLPHASLDDLKRLINEYLINSVHLAQPLMHERNIVRVSQAIRQHFGIEAAIRLLLEIERPNFEFASLFKKVPANEVSDLQEIKILIENIHKFYVYADVKKHDGFFEPEEEEAQRLFEAEMWINLQRYCCIQGMELIRSGEVYKGKQIEFKDFSKPFEFKPTGVESNENQVNKKQRKGDYVASPSSPSTSPVFDWSAWQGQMNEQAALEEALRRSQINSQVNSSQLQLQPSIAQPQRVNPQNQRELENQLFEAVRTGNFQLLQNALQNGVSVESKQNNKTPLMVAAEAGQYEMVKRLVEQMRANIHVSDQVGAKAIHYAARHSRLNVMAYLIRKGANATERDAYSSTPHDLAKLADKFLASAAAGNLQEVNSMITDLKVPVDVKNNGGKTALMAAAGVGNLSMLQHLIGKGASIEVVDNRNWNALNYASNNGHAQIVNFIQSVTAPKSVQAPVNNASKFFAQTSNPKTPQPTSQRPISNVVQPQKAKKSNHPTYFSASDIQIFIDMAASGSIEELQSTMNDLDVPVDIKGNYQGRKNVTLLIAATIAGKLEMVEYLVEKCNADINIADDSRLKAIQYSATHEKIMAYLIKKGADPTEKNIDGTSAHNLGLFTQKFFDAIVAGNIQRIEWLINDLKVPINSTSYYKDDFDLTALMVAADIGRFDVVKLLVEKYKAAIDIKSKAGKTAVDYAVSNGHLQIVNYLRTAQVNLFKNDAIASSEASSSAPPPLLASQIGNNPSVFFAEALQDKPANMESLSILEAAKAVIDKLKQQALLMQDQEDIEAPSWGSSDEDEKLFALTHGTVLSLEDSGLSPKRFYAMYHILQAAMSQVSQDPAYQNKLTMNVRQGTSSIQISAEHDFRVRRNWNAPRLPAPIAKVPFDKIKLELEKILKETFSSWQPYEQDPDTLICYFPDSEEKLYSMNSKLSDIEKDCRELEEGFELKIKFPRGRSCITINKAQFEKAKTMLLSPNVSVASVQQSEKLGEEVGHYSSSCR